MLPCLQARGVLQAPLVSGQATIDPSTREPASGPCGQSGDVRCDEGYVGDRELNWLYASAPPGQFALFPELFIHIVCHEAFQNNSAIPLFIA
jgi:hypothetical protein